MRPIRDLTEAVTTPLQALFVVGLCWVINAMTSPGVWWVQWVALGMGIATVVALARGLRTLLVIGLVAWIGRKLYRRYGAAAKARFDDWAASEPRPVGDLLRVAMQGRPQPG